MPEIPECLNRRYQALDKLMKELASGSYSDSIETCCAHGGDASAKVACNLWKTLQEDAGCNLPHAARQREDLESKPSMVCRPQRVACYMACSHGGKVPDKEKSSKTTCEKNPARSCGNRNCGSSKNISRKPIQKSETLPLNKVLCNLNEAISYDKTCNSRISELLQAQKQLQDQIDDLERREKEGIQMLKQAECMWSCMEKAYKEKLAKSQEAQNVLLQQMKEVEASHTKWRKNKKDLEFQLDNINKCCLEVTENSNEKKNEIKCVRMEMDNFKNRIECNKKDTEVVKKSLEDKKKASDAKIAKLSAEMEKLKKMMTEEINYKNEKERKGTTYVKEARADLQKICQVLLHKQLDNEDLMAEKQTLLQELDTLKQTSDQCKEKCEHNQQAIIDEIAKTEAEIANYKVKCIRCHECTDTADVRKLCSDCPRCVEERDCLYENSHCMPDSGQDCVCMSIKEKFLDNVFENMYSVLERISQTEPGKAVAQVVLECLRRSRNGKLDAETRRILQNFVLATIKKNLNLTIIGGAVKTRCEMDSDTYKQLMLCLKQIITVKPPKEDKEVAVKKDPCSRWGDTSECNCPKDSNGCACAKKAPFPQYNQPDGDVPPGKDDAAGLMSCSHKPSKKPCGTESVKHSCRSSVGAEATSKRPAPRGNHGQLAKNMRAAQCALGSEPLSCCTNSKGMVPVSPPIPNQPEDQDTCKCDMRVLDSCACSEELQSHPREVMIEEVMGRYTDVTPIQNVNYILLSDECFKIHQWQL